MNGKKKYLYAIQAIAIRKVFDFFSLFPPYLSSYIVGKIFYLFSACLPADKIVRRNLEIAFPQKNKNFYDRLKKPIWENLGRNFGELPHLQFLTAKTRIIGKEHLESAKKTGRPIIFVSAHFGNWELLPGLLSREGLTFSPVFRAPNNPHLNLFLRRIRQNNLPLNTPVFTKGSKDIRKILDHLKSGKHLGMLIDQKLNDGLKLRFFNYPAMTSGAAVSLALKTNALIVTGRIDRDIKNHLRLFVDPPIDLSLPSALGSKNTLIKHYSQRLNDHMESWITHSPSLWLWMHRRWDKSLYRKKIYPTLSHKQTK